MPFESRVCQSLRASPGPALRERVIAAAAPHVRCAVRWTDRFYFSRAWRSGAVVGFLLLIGVNLQPTWRHGGAPLESPADPETIAAIEMTGQQLYLPTDLTANLRVRAQSAVPPSASSLALAVDLLPELFTSGDEP